jgi:RelA/SpoT family (p)ppGpp synthetase
MFNLQLNSFLGKKETEEKPIGEDSEHDLQLLLQECKKYLKNYNEDKIKKAFLLCHDAHQNRLRKSGLPAYTHSLEVARIVIKEIPLDETSVICALLHDVLNEGEKVSLKDIQSEFGNTVAEIVEGVRKIEHIENTNLKHSDHVENYRKLLISLFKDIRIILIKLADRLHNMRTLEYLSEKSRNKLAKETIDVYGPFANRFGLRNIKWELEDLAFKNVNRQAYDDIKTDLKSTREEREVYVENFITPINEKLFKDDLLKKLKIKFEIEGRAKHIYSIYNKMKARNKPLNELYDLFAVRIIIDSEDPNMCFYIYGLIAGIYPPVPETFKDYINTPKRNGYQSIHTAVVGINNKIVEVQIRTEKMHILAENGFAAHFRYKSGKVDSHSILERKQIIDWIKTVREIFEHAGVNTSEELIDSVQKNLLFDEIYVYTPKNEFRTLPKDSTPLDFAFDIHTEIGYNYVGAKVNGKIVPMDYKLKSGDQIEILTSKNHFPKAEWLKYVTTPKSKGYIIKYLKEEEKENERKGKEIWFSKSKEFNIKISDSDLEVLAQSFKFDDIKEFFIALALQTIHLDKVFEFIHYKMKDGIRAAGDGMNSKPINQNSKTLNQNLETIQNRNLIIDDSLITYTSNDKIQTTITISANDKPQMLENINAVVLSTNDITLLGINYEIIESNLLENISLELSDKMNLISLIENLHLIGGINNIECKKL